MSLCGTPWLCERSYSFMQSDELKLSILRKADTIGSQRDLAQELGYSVGKINYVLNALIDKGLIKVENFATAENKKKYSYLLTKKGIKEKMVLTEKFIRIKKHEYHELQDELKNYINDMENKHEE